LQESKSRYSFPVGRVFWMEFRKAEERGRWRRCGRRSEDLGKRAAHYKQLLKRAAVWELLLPGAWRSAGQSGRPRRDSFRVIVARAGRGRRQPPSYAKSTDTVLRSSGTPRSRATESGSAAVRPARQRERSGLGLLLTQSFDFIKARCEFRVVILTRRIRLRQRTLVGPGRHAQATYLFSVR
jgi:hypothetical protein